MIKIKQLLILLLVLFSVNLHAVELDEVKGKINKLVTSLVQSHDVNAVVDIDYKVETKKQNLPNLPFVYKTEKKIQNEYKFKEVSINIYNSSNESYAELETLISEEVKKHINIVPMFNYKRVPKKVVVINEPTDFKSIVYSILGLLAIIAVGFIAWAQQKKLGEGRFISDKLSNIATSIEQSMGQGSNQQAAKPSANTTKIEISNQEGSVWETITVESLSAIVSDCYWCELDSYAAFIWSKIKSESKKQLLDSLVVPVDYIDYISVLEGDDEGHVKSPYYLNPSSLHQVSNSDLTDVVKAHPFLVRHISDVRYSRLQLDIDSKVSISQTTYEKDFDKANTLFSKAKKSELRVMAQHRTMQSQTDEEEVQIMAMQATSSLAQSIQSLAWLHFLADEDLTQLLLDFNAKDLALAWIGPVQLMDKLKSHMPAGKYELISSYVERVQPSRNSIQYKSLWLKACDLIVSYEGDDRTDDEQAA